MSAHLPVSSPVSRRLASNSFACSSTCPSPQPTFRRRHRASLRVTAEAVRDAGDWHKQDIKHVVESQSFSRESLDIIFAEARRMETVKRRSPEAKALDGFIMSTLFYEPSTRTRLSFESAMTRLGGSILTTESAGEYSSAAKGETLEDTIRTVEGYADCIVLRHFQEGAARRAANVAGIPIINAGDGPGQHPTQALLDMYTIQREVGRLDNIRVGLVGDLANGRTVHSLAYLLSKFNNVKMYFVAPDVVRMKDNIKDMLTSYGLEWEELANMHEDMLSNRGVEWEESADLHEVAADVDVLYQTRIQKERFKNPEDYAQAQGKYIIDQEIMKLLPKSGVVMHPMPRVNEIAVEVDSDPRAAYFRQAQNGLYVRMAVLKLCLLGIPSH